MLSVAKSLKLVSEKLSSQNNSYEPLTKSYYISYYQNSYYQLSLMSILL